MVLSTAYLPNIQYISKFKGEKSPLIEACENFQKQTYRNRADIMTAEGVRQLVVPIEWRHNLKMPIRDVRIDNSEPWQRTHWRTLRAAYAASPYFEHYAHKIEPYYGKKYDFLWDLNCELTAELLRTFRLPSELKFTEDYVVHAEDDFRNCISHKPRLQRPDPSFVAPVYYQVFSERQPFAPNLSIVDYLFCEGANL